MSTGMIRRMQSFYERLKHPLFYNYMQDLVQTSRARLHDVYKDKQRENEFILYEKYASLPAICEQMGRTPPWAKGLVLRADGYETQFYKKD